MLYSIILPAVIILSLGVVVIFLAKKAPAIKKIEEEGQFEENLKKEDQKTSWQKICFFCGKTLFPGMKKLTIFLASKIKSAVVSIFKGLFSRSKKEKRTEKTEEDPLLQKIKDYQPQEDRGRRSLIDEEEEKTIRPMISDKVTNPKSKIEMKDRLEDILIERVAANPRDVEAYERLGEYYFEIGEMMDAKECFKQVIKLDGTNRRAKFKLKRLEKELEK